MSDSTTRRVREQEGPSPLSTPSCWWRTAGVRVSRDRRKRRVSPGAVAAPASRALFRRRRDTTPRQAALRGITQRALFFLVPTLAAVGADATVLVVAQATAAASGGAFHSERNSRERRGGAVAGGPAKLRPCGREAAACADDAECHGCSAMVMGWYGGKTTALPGCDGVGGGGRGGVRDGSRADLFFETVPPTTTRCDKVGAAVCRGFTEAAAGAAGLADAIAQQEEGGFSGPRRTESCLGNRKVQALLACVVRTACCEPDDAPCITENRRRGGGGSSSEGESNAGADAKPTPRPLSEDLERGSPAAAAAAAAAAANDKGFAPSEWARMYQRRLATTSSGATCDGIQSGSACCSAACGECGGSRCSVIGNGAEDCCTGDILDSGIVCSDTGGAAPCIVDGRARTSGEGRGDPEPQSSSADDATIAPETSEPTPSQVTPETPSPVAPGVPGEAQPVLPTPTPVVGGVVPTPEPVDEPPMATTLPLEKSAPPTATAALLSGFTAPPTLAPVAMKASSPRAAPTVSPTTSAASDTERTVVPAAQATVAADEEFGLLGPGFMSGSFSADGVSDELVASLGEEGVVQQVVCELGPCPGGLESVLVGSEAVAPQLSWRARLLSAHAHNQTVNNHRGRDPHQTVRHRDRAWLRGEDRTRHRGDEEGVEGRILKRQRRRLADIEDVAFAVPSERGIEGEGGEVMTASQQAAAFVNKMADPVLLAEIAADLGLDVEDLDFAHLAFYHGSSLFPIEKEFDAGCLSVMSNCNGEDNDPGQAGTWILALCLVALVVLLMWISCHCLEKIKGEDESRNPLGRLDSTALDHRGVVKRPTASARTSVDKMPTVDEEAVGDVDVSGDEVGRKHHAAPPPGRGGGHSFSRCFRPAELAQRVWRHGKKAVVAPRTEPVGRFYMQRGGVEMVTDYGKSDGDDDDVSHGRFKYRNGLFRRQAGQQSFVFDDQGVDSSSGNSSGDWSSDRSSGLESSSTCSSCSETGSENGDGEWRPRAVARIATRAPQGYGRSYASPALPRVPEKDSMGRGESDVTDASTVSAAFGGGGREKPDVTDSSTMSAAFGGGGREKGKPHVATSTSTSTLPPGAAPTGLVRRDFLELLIVRAKGRSEADATTLSVPAGGDGPGGGGPGGRDGGGGGGVCDRSSSERADENGSGSTGVAGSGGGSSIKKAARMKEKLSLDSSFSDEEAYSSGSVSSSWCPERELRVEARRRSFLGLMHGSDGSREEYLPPELGPMRSHIENRADAANFYAPGGTGSSDGEWGIDSLSNSSGGSFSRGASR